MTETQQLEQIRAKENTQPLIVDFYNLHLQSGPKYDKSKIGIRMETHSLGRSYRAAPYEEDENIVVEEVYPDKDEQNRIIKFLETYAPELKHRFGFEWYEEQTRKSWPESKHFLRFADDYDFTKKLINEYMDGTLLSREIEWLSSMFGFYKLGLRLISNKDDKEYRTFPRLFDTECPHRELWKIDDYRIDYMWTGFHFPDREHLPYYGIGLEKLWREIITELCEMLRTRWKISRCHYNKCRNIFVLGSGRYRKLYCSNAHRVRAFRDRKAARMASE